MLYAVEIPPYGGDTLFANQYRAYEMLSEGLKRTLGGLIAITPRRRPRSPGHARIACATPARR